MAMNVVPDEPDDQHPLEGPLDSSHAAFDQHEQVMGDLLPTSSEQPVAEIREGHDTTLDELAGPQISAAPRASMLEEVKAVTNEPAEPPKQKGRYYVPPSERNHKNRAERRAAVAESRGEANPAEAPTLQQFFEQGGKLSDGADDGNEKVINLMESGHQLLSTLSHAVIDLTRRLNELTEAVERARL